MESRDSSFYTGILMFISLACQLLLFKFMAYVIVQNLDLPESLTQVVKAAPYVLVGCSAAWAVARLLGQKPVGTSRGQGATEAPETQPTADDEEPRA